MFDVTVAYPRPRSALDAPVDVVAGPHFAEKAISRKHLYYNRWKNPNNVGGASD